MVRERTSRGAARRSLARKYDSDELDTNTRPESDVDTPQRTRVRRRTRAPTAAPDSVAMREKPASRRKARVDESRDIAPPTPSVKEDTSYAAVPHAQGAGAAAADEPDDLLFDPIAMEKRIRRQRKVQRAVTRACPALRVLFLLAVIVLIVAIPIRREPFSRETYVDENALQPGQTDVSWGADDIAYADRVSADLHAIARTGSRTQYVAASMRC